MSSLPLKEFFTNPETWKYVFWNCIFLNFMHPWLPGCFNGTSVAVNGALWTIKVEIAFYLLLPILILFLKKLKNLKQVNITLLVLYVLSAIYTVFFQKYADVLHLPHQLGNQFPAFVTCFVSGMFCLFNWNFICKKINLLVLPSVLIFAFHYILKTEFLMPFVLSMIVVFVALRTPCLNFIGSRTDFSYPMYLFHFPLIQLLTHYGFYRMNFVLSSFLTFAGTFFISFLVLNLLNKKKSKSCS